MKKANAPKKSKLRIDVEIVRNLEHTHLREVVGGIRPDSAASHQDACCA